MVLTPKVSLIFKREKPSPKTSFGTNVVNALGGLTATKSPVKDTYGDLPVPVATLQQLNTDLTSAIAAALDGGKQARNGLKNAVKAWNAGFGETANYISTVAQGDIATILASGYFPTKSQTQPSPKPGPATDFNATINGKKGAIIAGSKTAVPDAKLYVYSAVPDGASVSYEGNTMVITVGDKNIYIVADTRKQTELYNLASGVPVNVSMYAVNSAGSGPATAAQQVIPQ